MPTWEEAAREYIANSKVLPPPEAEAELAALRQEVAGLRDRCAGLARENDELRRGKEEAEGRADVLHKELISCLVSMP